MSKKLKIGVDIDEVLAPFNETFISYLNKIKGTNFNSSEMKTYWIEDYTGYSRGEILDLIDNFYEAEEFHSMSPIFESVESIKNISHLELFAITARPKYSKDGTELWLEKHFPNVFKELHLIGRSVKGEEAKPEKGLFSKDLGVEIFIEDSLSNAIDISKHSIPVILLDKPWNQEENLPENIYRVKNWPEILSKIEDLKNVI